MSRKLNGECICCLRCGAPTIVKDSRGTEAGHIWRRRQCTKNPKHACLTTYELSAKEGKNVMEMLAEAESMKKSIKTLLWWAESKNGKR
jgi:transcriptional regulator NrdR family protein